MARCSNFCHFLLLLVACILAVIDSGGAYSIVPIPFLKPKYGVVPSASDYGPHRVYEGANITLKAMLRSTCTSGTYTFKWDTNRNGVFTDDGSSATGTRSAGSFGMVNDIGALFTVPLVSGNTYLNVTVLVTES